jgi:hypothetical protein
MLKGLLDLPIEEKAQEIFNENISSYPHGRIPNDVEKSIWLFSIATSLKRIADIIDGSTPIQIDPGTHNNLTHLAWEMGRSFQHGTRTDR